MDKNKIAEILDQLVEWQEPKPMDDKMVMQDINATRRHLRKLGHDEDAIEEVLKQIEEDSSMIVDGVNITIPKRIKRRKPQAKLCELGCGKIAVDQVVEISYHTTPYKHKRERCKFCQYYKLEDGTFARNAQQMQFFLTKNKRKPTK